MLKRFEWSLKFYKLLIGIVPLVALIASLLTPSARLWMASHSEIGWIAAFVLPMVVFLLMDYLRSSQHSAASKIKDYNLIMERLDGWSLESSFYKYLNDRGTDAKLSTKVTDDIEDRSASWDRDVRRIKNRKLRSAFNKTREALNIYHLAIINLMDTQEIEIRSSSRKVEERLILPLDLKGTNPAEFYKMNSELQTKRRALVNALAHLFKVLHDASPVS